MRIPDAYIACLNKSSDEGVSSIALTPRIVDGCDQSAVFLGFPHLSEKIWRINTAERVPEYPDISLIGLPSVWQRLEFDLLESLRLCCTSLLYHLLRRVVQIFEF